VNLNIDLVPLQQANLCLDCELITAGHTECLVCGSRALLNIARVLSHRSDDVQRTENVLSIYTSARGRLVHSKLESGRQRVSQRRSPLMFPLHASESRA